ncbi:hypothetical protein EV363DRAFT_1099987, partial [Boletus edulis]
CAVCLSTKPHTVPVAECDKDKTWDGKHETFAKQVNRQLITKANNQRLCMKWQRREGCINKQCFAHICSGCGTALHGAIQCPRAQR